MGVFEDKDQTPDIDFSPVGRLRLVGALSKKFGTNFRNNPGANEALKAFDGEMDFSSQIRSLRSMK